MATVESSAFFLRDHRTGNEIIVFGDVEPDSVSLDPHNKRVWETAAPKVAAGTLRAIFIECSYNDSIDDAYLYGHMCPRHLVAELTVLATKVMEARESLPGERKRKREATSGSDAGPEQISPRSKRNQSASGERERKSKSLPEPRSHYSPSETIGDLPDGAKDGSVAFGDLEITNEVTNTAGWEDADPLPLTGLSVYIIHIKENLTDGPPPGERILRELRAHSKEAHLGCEFLLPNPAEGIWI